MDSNKRLVILFGVIAVILLIGFASSLSILMSKNNSQVTTTATVTATATATRTITTTAQNNSQTASDATTIADLRSILALKESRTLLNQTTVTLNGMGYSSACNCTNPGFWSWNGSSFSFPYAGYIVISLGGQIPSSVQVTYTINGTANSLFWCFGSKPYCLHSVNSLSVPVTPSVKDLSIFLIDTENSTLTAEISATYHY